MLNTLRGQVGEQPEATPKEAKACDNLMMFVDIKLNEKATHALVDKGATQFYNRPRSKVT